MARPSDTAELAETLLADAFSHRYRYPSDYPGWSALARFGRDATELEATVAVAGPGDAEAVAMRTVPAADGEWALQELRSLSRSLYGHDYCAGEGRFEKSLDDSPHPLGPLVILHDDPHQATFRVRRHRITLATRRQHALLEMVRVDRWHVRSDGRCVPAQWTLEVWDDAHARPLRTDRYWDLYWPFGGELVPQMRRVETSDDLGIKLTRTLRLAEWQLA